MAIEWVQFNSAVAFAAGPAAENFRIDVDSRIKSPGSILSSEDIEAQTKLLLVKPEHKRTFLMGPFTSKIDPALGKMRDEDIELIEAVHRFYEESLRVDCYSSFRRECYGQVGIGDDHATFLDKLAIETSHILTVLPGSSKSDGTWEEIRYGGALGRAFLFLFRQDQPEEEFQQHLRTKIANLSTHPFLVFVTFRSLEDMFEQMRESWQYALANEVNEREWENHVQYLRRSLLREISW